MRIGYFVRNIGVSGGVKVMCQHVRLLREAGYDALLITEKVKDRWDLDFEPVVLGEGSHGRLPDCDRYVGTVYSDVSRLCRTQGNRVIHLCQGYEPIEYKARLDGEVLTDRYRRKGIFSSLERHLDRRKFLRRMAEIERVYALPTRKAAVSPHLAELIEKRYGQRCSLVRNGIDMVTFYPATGRVWRGSGKIRVLSVGSGHVGVKGIPDTLNAVRMLKEDGMDIEFIRVSPAGPSEMEQMGGLVDRYLTGLREQEMAALYRDTDIFISSSLEGEGFGLPVIEALASGVPTILTEISTHRGFSDKRDFGCFVPVHRPDAIAEAVRTLIADSELRERSIIRGLEVAARFTLEQTKQDLLDFLRGL
jgi:glycosyltransferase involved in cell wall biosynthesis